MLNIGEFARLGQVSPRMLRHYDELGLLQPSRVDAATGYRSYAVAQRSRLHRLLALRDLGFSLEQIGGLLDAEPPLDQLRGMLRIRQAQIEQTVADEQARLRRVEAHLRALEGSTMMNSPNVVVKTTEAMRIAQASATAPGFGSENLGPVFGRLLPDVLAHLDRAGARPGVCVGWYEEPNDDRVSCSTPASISATRLSLTMARSGWRSCRALRWHQSCTMGLWKTSSRSTRPWWAGAKTAAIASPGAAATSISISISISNGTITTPRRM